MAKYSPITGKALILALRKAGFLVQRVKGSHQFPRHSDGRTTVVPVHSGDRSDQDYWRKCFAMLSLQEMTLKLCLLECWGRPAGRSPGQLACHAGVALRRRAIDVDGLGDLTNPQELR